MSPAESQVLQTIANIVGAKHCVTAAAELRPYLTESRGRYTSECQAVVLPSNADEVAAVVRCCAAAGISIVPQGGNTGAVGGAVAARGQIIVNLARLKHMEVDAANATVRAQAGCILQDVQTAAADQQLFFPLSFGAEGSCQIGGCLATNAGGMRVLRYGNARDLTLGLQVVLADGRVYDNLRGLRKDNSGLDMQNLFIGAEGTLGIITAATLKLFPPPRLQVTLLAGLAEVDATLELLRRLRAATDERCATFELMGELPVATACQHIQTQSRPLTCAHPWYALAAATAATTDAGLRAAVEQCLAIAARDGLIGDAVIAQNARQEAQLFALRANVVAAQTHLGASVKHDISAPLSRVPELLRRAPAVIAAAVPGARPYPFGHLGDGNIHLNISQPADWSAEKFLAHRAELNRAVHDLAAELNGSFAAEHGVGLAKLDDMRRYKDSVSMALYRSVKQALDPHNIFNPGKVIP